MAKWNKLALNIVMVVFGVLMIVGGLLASVGTTIFPFDSLIGTRATIGAVAFGAGLALAGMQPAVPATWVRAGLFYCLLDVLYEVVNLFCQHREPAHRADPRRSAHLPLPVARRPLAAQRQHRSGARLTQELFGRRTHNHRVRLPIARHRNRPVAHAQPVARHLDFQLI